MKISILFLLVISSVYIYPQSWQKKNVSVSHSATIGPFSIINENVCWASWTTDSPSNSQPTNGFIRTTDGGATWSSGEVSATANGICKWIEAIDELTAFLVVEKKSVGGMQGIYKTTDGGATWIKHQTAYVNSNLGPGYIHFFDTDNGVVVGEQNGQAGFEIFTTTNSGTDWNEVPQTNIPPLNGTELLESTPPGKYGDCVWLSTFPPNGSGSRIFRTTDKGYHWDVIEQPGLKDYYVFSLAFQSETTGLMVMFSTFSSADFAIKKTTDSGETWNNIYVDCGCSPRFISYIPGTNSGYIISGDNNYSDNSGGSAFSLDAGNKWTKIDDGNYYAPCFSSPSNGWCSHYGSGSVYKFSGTLTSVQKGTNNGFSTSYSLEQNYPNPFNPSTTIKFGIKERVGVKITILNSIGEEINTILNEEKEPGQHQVNFSAPSLASGVYFYKINAGNYSSIKKMILLK